MVLHGTYMSSLTLADNSGIMTSPWMIWMKQWQKFMWSYFLFIFAEEIQRLNEVFPELWQEELISF